MIPAQYLAAQKLCICSVSNALISSRYKGTCPKCRPAARAAECPGDPVDDIGPAPSSNLPSLDEVHLRHVPVVKYVPKAARKLWAPCVSKTAASAVFFGSVAAWTEWQMLAKAVLCTPPRNGKLHKRQVESFTVDRCRRWLAGELVPDLDADIVRKAIRGFPRGTAPGPSGLRAQHLLDALKTAHGDEMLEQVTAMTNVLAQGRAPRELAPHLAGAALLALGTKDGGVRPIAVGECLRRLVAKCLCDVFRDDARAWLWPFQIGVGVPFGVEIGAHTASQWMERNRDEVEKVFLKIDFENAFNSVGREAFLREIRSRLPGLQRVRK
eukprot:gene18124-biopygen33237